MNIIQYGVNWLTWDVQSWIKEGASQICRLHFHLQKKRMKSFDGKCWCQSKERKRQNRAAQRRQATECLHFRKQKTSLGLVLTGWVRQTEVGLQRKPCIHCVVFVVSQKLAFFQSLNTVGNKIRATFKENCSFLCRQTGCRAERCGLCLERLVVTVTFTSKTSSWWFYHHSVSCFIGGSWGSLNAVTL